MKGTSHCPMRVFSSEESGSWKGQVLRGTWAGGSSDRTPLGAYGDLLLRTLKL